MHRYQFAYFADDNENVRSVQLNGSFPEYSEHVALLRQGMVAVHLLRHGVPRLICAHQRHKNSIPEHCVSIAADTVQEEFAGCPTAAQSNMTTHLPIHSPPTMAISDPFDSFMVNSQLRCTQDCRHGLCERPLDGPEVAD